MRSKPALLALAAALLAGCGRDATAPAASELGSADAALLAEELDVLTSTVLGAQIGSLVFALPDNAEPVPINRSFTGTRQCPAGGSVAVAGTASGELDWAARSLTIETTATRTENACAIPARKQGGATLTLNGNPNVVVTGRQKIVAGQPVGPQTLTQKGGFTWSSSDGRSGSCTLDLTSTLDFATQTYTVKGTMCGQTVDVSKHGVRPGR